MSIHTLEVLVENEPGVLARVAGLFARRAYNIDTLVVGPTENSEISKMVIQVNLEGHSLEQVMAQLDKLITVISIKELIDGAVKNTKHETQPDYQN
jgi:acetolactate synthase small subunit